MLRKLEVTIVGASLLFGSVGSVAAQKRGAVAKAVTARYIVQMTFDDEYRSTTDKPNEIDSTRSHDTGKAESRVHLVVEASRWLKVQSGDGGATEFVSLEGHEPSAGSATVTVSATSESRSDNATGEKNRVVSVNSASATFSGKAAPPNVIEDESPLSIGLPQFSELGNGLEFRIRVKVGLAGSCESKSVDEHGTRTDRDCSSASPVVAEGFTVKGENPNKGNAQAVPYLSEVAEDLSILPSLSPEQEKLMPATERQKDAGVFIGAETKGDRTLGYKSHLTTSKTILHDRQDGVTSEEVQKLDFTAQIVPGSPAAAEALLDLYIEDRIDLGEPKVSLLCERA